MLCLCLTSIIEISWQSDCRVCEVGPEHSWHFIIWIPAQFDTINYPRASSVVSRASEPVTLRFMITRQYFSCVCLVPGSDDTTGVNNKNTKLVSNQAKIFNSQRKYFNAHRSIGYVTRVESSFFFLQPRAVFSMAYILWLVSSLVSTFPIGRKKVLCRCSKL